MRKCYTMRNGELVVREIRTFSAVASIANDEPDSSTRKVFAETNDESLSAWAVRRAFSITTIDIRLHEARKNLRERLKRVYRDYKRYADSKLKNDDLDNYIAMLDNELMILITSAADSIVEGKTLVSVLGLSSLGGNLKSLGQKFTIAYRKSLRALDSTGTVTPVIYRKVNETLNDLIDEFHLLILGSERYESIKNPIALQ